MSSPTNADLTILQGRTFRKIVRWESARFAAVAIASMSVAGITQITTTSAHNITDGWRVAVVDAQGMTELNARNNPPKDKDFREATVVSADVIEFNAVSSAAFRPYTGGGFLKWRIPHALAGYTARMTIKDRVGGSTLLALTSGAGLFIDADAKIIEISVDADTTEAITWTSGVYDLEMVSPDGEVTAILTGAVTVENEITT